MVDPSYVALLNDGATATAALKGWIPFVAIVGIIATGWAFVSKGLKLAIPSFLGFAVVVAFLYNPEGMGTLGKALLSVIGINI